MLKRFTFNFLLITFSISNFSYAQNFNWITPSKTYLKMYTVNEGLTRISRSDFVTAGINTTLIDPRTVKVLNKGIQVPIYFSGEQDGVFNEGDYFDFYASRIDGGLTNTYDQYNNVVYTTNEYYNQYSDTNVYWIDWAGDNGLRFLNRNFNTTELYPSDFYNTSVHFEKDKLYSQGESTSNLDTRFLNTERFRGEGWYWSLLSNTQTVSDTFSSPGLYSAPQNASLRIFAYPQNSSASIFNEHSLEVSVNGNLVFTIFTNDFKLIDSTINFSSSVLSSSSVNNISIKYKAAPGFDGRMYFDLFELFYPKSFKIYNNNLTASLNSDTTSKLFKIKGFNPSNTVNVFDVKNNIRISGFTSSIDTLKLICKSNAKLVIVNDSVRLKPIRIKQRMVPNLVSNSNAADYLLIYHSLFQQQAEQLRAHRESQDNFRSVKAEIQDIYDIFNYGLDDPIALKYFVKHAYDFWQLPKMKYVCLFGRGSFDPKKNAASTLYENNYIPVYGNPNSDGYYANFNIGTFFYYSQLSIGRIPAYNENEAQAMVNKIIAYENELPEKWWKTFAFITGGSTPGEQNSYQQRSNFEINQYVIGFPIYGEAVKIYRTDLSGGTTFNYADSIKNVINRGSLFVNFRGHAGNHDWEVGMSDPNVLSNGNRLPLVLSLTCFTGENAKPDFRGFGEKFMYYGNKGAIGFISTTGWSYEAYGNDFGTYIIQSIKLDTTRRLGELVKAAAKFMSSDSNSFAIRHTVNCYNLLGDPAVKLKLPRYPEFVITNNDYKLSTESVTLNEPVSLRITPKNYGLYADTCRIRYQLKKNNTVYLTKDTNYRAFKFLDTLFYNFKIDTPGVYSMTVTLDVNNRYPSKNESNNSITFNVPFREYLFLPISPVENSIVYKDSVEYSGLNPILNFSQNSVKLILQSDTNKNFNSPVLQTYIRNSLEGTYTKFNSSLPVLNNNTIYYWRTNSIINNDSAGWTKTRTFIYSNGPIVKEAERDRLTGANIYADLYKFNKVQFSDMDFSNTNFNSTEGIKLNENTINLFVRSFGNNGEEASFFSVGSRNVYIDGAQNAGLNLLKVKKLNGSLIDFRNFRMTSAASSDSIVTFLSTFDSTYYLMLLNASYSIGGTFFTEPAKAKLRQFGSIYCDSIGLLGYFHTWSLIAYLGAAHSQVSEMFDACCTESITCQNCSHWTQSTSSMNVNIRKTSGTVSNIFGPSKEWTDFKWRQSIPSSSNILFDIIGVDFDGNQTLLRPDVQTNNYVELSSINAVQYPFLNLVAKLNIDTISGSQSPILQSLNLSYSPASEIILDKNTLQVNSSSRDNNIINFSFDYHNSGFAFIYGTIVNVYNGPVSDSNLILTDTVSSVLKIDSTKNYSNSFVAPSFRDSTRIYLNIKPKDNPNEFYTFNNSADFRINSETTISEIALTVFSDDKEIVTGDYISKNPEIKININSSREIFLLSDTAQINLILNEKYIPNTLNRTADPILKTFDSGKKSNGNNLSLLYYPSLNFGKNKLTIIYKDDLNRLDTVSYDVFVNSELLVNDLYNYPNPMKNETNFIFNITGSLSDYQFKLKIYSVSGRLIKEVQYSANLGINNIPWDGKDSDGDFVANGTYFYKLIYDGDSKTEFKVQKLVVLK